MSKVSKIFDYTWDVTADRILLDSDLDIDKLGWKHGDCFKITNVNSQAMLVKLHPLEKFLKGKDL